MKKKTFTTCNAAMESAVQMHILCSPMVSVRITLACHLTHYLLNGFPRNDQEKVTDGVLDPTKLVPGLM